MTDKPSAVILPFPKLKTDMPPEALAENQRLRLMTAAGPVRVNDLPSDVEPEAS